MDHRQWRRGAISRPGNVGHSAQRGRSELRRAAKLLLSLWLAMPAAGIAQHREAGLIAGELPSTLYAKYSPTLYSACLGSCHSSRLVEEKQSSEATRFRNGDDNLHFRHVARRSRGRSCRLCHTQHVPPNPALVREGMPFGEERLTLEFTATDRGGKCATSCHVAAEYDRDKSISSSMRVAPPDTPSEAP